MVTFAVKEESYNSNHLNPQPGTRPESRIGFNNAREYKNCQAEERFVSIIKSGCGAQTLSPPKDSMQFCFLRLSPIARIPSPLDIPLLSVEVEKKTKEVLSAVGSQIQKCGFFPNRSSNDLPGLKA